MNVDLSLRLRLSTDWRFFFANFLAFFPSFFAMERWSDLQINGDEDGGEGEERGELRSLGFRGRITEKEGFCDRGGGGAVSTVRSSGV